MRIPRPLLQEQKAIQETAHHVFCDASQDAYGACAYLRSAFTDDTLECRLVAGKDRISPFKWLSICRLEPMGALLAVRLPEKLGKEMTTKMEKIIFWSYSTTVLHLICQKSSTYKAFVGNRVSEIHTIMRSLETTLRAGRVSWKGVGKTCTVHKEDAEGNSGTQEGFQRSAENYASRSRRNTKRSTDYSYVQWCRGHWIVNPKSFLAIAGESELWICWSQWWWDKLDKDVATVPSTSQFLLETFYQGIPS